MNDTATCQHGERIYWEAPDQKTALRKLRKLLKERDRIMTHKPRRLDLLARFGLKTRDRAQWDDLDRTCEARADRIFRLAIDAELCGCERSEIGEHLFLMGCELNEHASLHAVPPAPKPTPRKRASASRAKASASGTKK